MKKLIALLLLAVMCVGVAACGEAESPEVSGTQTESSEIDTSVSNENTETENVFPDTSTEDSPDTSAEDSSTTEEPSTVTTDDSEGSSTQTQASSSTQKPASSSTQKPSTSTTTDAPSSATDKPASTSTQKPASTSTQKPPTSTTTDTPSSATDKPASTSSKKPASTSTQKPASTSSSATNSGTTEDTAPKFTTINVPSIPQKDKSIAAITQKATTIGKAEFKTYNGTISVLDQVDTYTFTAPRDGIYRFQLSQMKSGFSVSLFLYTNLEENIVYDIYTTNGGVTANLKKGETYIIKIYENYYGFDHNSGEFGSYTLSIGFQKPTVEVSQFTKINDSIEYRDQVNVYTFTAPLDGTYRFQLSQMKSGFSVDLDLYNNLGNCITYGIANGGTTANLKQGETYIIKIVEGSQSFENNPKLGTYTLSIGLQKSTVEVSQFTKINDSIEYRDQANVYTFKAPLDGTYRFQLSQMKSNFSVRIYLYDDLEESIEDRKATNEGITATLKQGKTYTVKIVEPSQSFEQDPYLGTYTLSIGLQKQTVNVKKMTKVNDSIEYEDQINIYSFTPTTNGNYTINLSGMDSSMRIKFKCLDDLDFPVDSGTYSNGKTVTLENLTAGKTYLIHIQEYSGNGKYTLTIQ